MDEKNESRIFIVKAKDTNDLYCFDQSCLEQIRTEHVYPNSTVELDTNTIEEVRSSECLNKMVTTCEEKSVDQSHEIVRGMITANDATYCQASEDCEVTGIIMCIGVFIVHPSDGCIALHYISGNDGSESKKLTNARNIMNQQEWTDSDIDLFLYINVGGVLADVYKKARDNSLTIIQKFFNKKGYIVAGKLNKMNYKSLRKPTEPTAVDKTDIYNQALIAIRDTQSLEEALKVKPTVKTFGEVNNFRRYIREIYSEKMNSFNPYESGVQAPAKPVPRR